MLLPATDKKEEYDMTDQAQSKSLKEIDQLFHMHGNTSISMLNSTGPVVMDYAQGMRITDTDGNEYLDSIAGLWCMTLGYGRSEIGDVAKEVIDKLSFVHTFGNGTCEPTTLLAQKLVTMFNDTVPGASLSLIHI